MIITLILLFLVFFSCCSTSPKSVDNKSRGQPTPTIIASIEAKQVAFEYEAQSVIETLFEKKSEKLNFVAQKRIINLLNSLEGKKRIKNIKLIVWSDKGYPSLEQNSTSENDSQLVQKRAEEIIYFIEQQKISTEFDVIDMSQRPGKIATWWGNLDVQIKKSLEDSEGAETASRAFILFFLENSFSPPN